MNAQLWDIEDALRRQEVSSEFGEPFVALARRVYLANDQRAAVKRKVDCRPRSTGGENSAKAIALLARQQLLLRIMAHTKPPLAGC